MTIGVIIQSRLGSSRFPKKALAELAGKPVLRHVIDRCKEAEVGEVVVATPDLELREMCRYQWHAAAVWVNRHMTEEGDVLKRFVVAGNIRNFEVIIRVCGDCPLIDPQSLCDLRSEHYKNPDAEYIGYWCSDTNKPAVLGNAGMPELVKLQSLVNLQTWHSRCKEHVTWGLYQKQSVTANHWIVRSGLSKLRNTIDTPEDLRRINKWLKSKSAVA